MCLHTKCQFPECKDSNIYHHAKCHKIKLRQKDIDKNLIECTGYLTVHVIGPIDSEPVEPEQPLPALIDDLSPDDWETGNIVAKPVVWTIYNRIHSELPQPFEYSINFKIDYNYKDIFRNGIPSENLIELSLKKINKSSREIFMTTIQAQFKDEHVPEMNAYSRPEIIHQFHPS